MERRQPAVRVEEGVLKGVVRQVGVVQQVEGQKAQAFVVQVDDGVERRAVAALGGVQRERVDLAVPCLSHRTPAVAPDFGRQAGQWPLSVVTARASTATPRVACP